MALLFMSIVTFWLSPFAEACTGTCLINKNGMVIAESLDQDPDNIGDVHVHSVGFASSSYMVGFAEEPYRWVAKYGSLSVSQMGLGSPSGGLNTAGLFVHRLADHSKQTPLMSGTPGQPLLHSFQVPQMLLDTCATVREALEKLQQVRIYQSPLPLHFWFCDLSGECAAIDFDKMGRLVIRTGKEMPLKTFANNDYEMQLDWYRQNFSTTEERRRRFYAEELTQQEPTSELRFSIAADLTQTLPDEAPLVDYGFQLLKAVKQPNWTLWQMVYAQQEQKIYLRHNKSSDYSEGIQIFDMKKIDFSLSNHGQLVPLIQANSGDMTSQFVPWSRKRNAEVIQQPAISFLPDVLLQTMMMHDKQSMLQVLSCRDRLVN